MEKVLKIAFIEIFSRQKTLKNPTHPAVFYTTYGGRIGLQPN